MSPGELVNAQNQISESLPAAPVDDDAGTSEYSFSSTTGGVPTPSDGSLSDALEIDFQIRPTADSGNSGVNLVGGDGTNVDGDPDGNLGGNNGGNDDANPNGNSDGNAGGNAGG
uniref:Uncharacterized protein n=1 Tax=Tetranychus urticae TaxID=32264 RepID=T1KA93_TETUR